MLKKDKLNEEPPFSQSQVKLNYFLSLQRLKPFLGLLIKDTHEG